jgi:hypothetical protein
VIRDNDIQSQLSVEFVDDIVSSHNGVFVYVNRDVAVDSLSACPQAHFLPFVSEGENYTELMEVFVKINF